MKTRKYFAAANSSNGFVNCFDNILDRKSSGYTYILKGGPGCGKSTLMRRVGKTFEDKGVEYFYCSSDPSSLDGVRIIEKNICIIDGTAPHTYDASMSKVFDEIVNLGDCISQNVLEKKYEITELQRSKKAAFDKFYRLLASAKAVEDVHKSFQIDKERARNLADETIKTINKMFGDVIRQKVVENYIDSDVTKAAYFQRKLFISAIDRFGKIIDYTSANKYSQSLVLDYDCDPDGLVIYYLYQKLKATRRDITIFLDDFDSGKISKLYLSDLDLIISTVPNDKDKLANAILDEAYSYLNIATTAHKAIESIYNPYIDFGANEIIANSLLEKIISR